MFMGGGSRLSSDEHLININIANNLQTLNGLEDDEDRDQDEEDAVCKARQGLDPRIARMV